MDSSHAILWTRWQPPAPGASARLRAEVATDAAFQSVVFRGEAEATPQRDHTARIEASGLEPGTRYHYRFLAEDGSVSASGRFRTAPRAGERQALHFAFSGDADGRWRPYPVVQGISDRDLDFFVFLGDTMYEVAAGRPGDGPPRHSPAATDPFRDPERALADYRRKYRENIQPVNPGGMPSLCEMFQATGHYTLLDNHELGNAAAQSGGAPVDPGAGASGPDATPGPPYINHTEAFRSLMQAYADYQPIREIVQSSGDPREDGTLRLWFEQRWGHLATFVNLDDRSYRDVRLRRMVGDDTGPRADNPRRTMLGPTQLAWAKKTLLQAERDGVVWKFVAVSSPIDENGGESGAGDDGGKSWAGGYRAERNELLSYLDREGIRNVVFLTTDDHLFRANELFYTAPGRDADGRGAGQRHIVPGAFTLVAGPLGAGGPDLMMNHAIEGADVCPTSRPLFALSMPTMSERTLADCIARHQRAQGLAPLGLQADRIAVSAVRREGLGAITPTPIGFFSRDTFNYCELGIDAATARLHVELRGLRSYPASSFPEPDPGNPVHGILSFDVDPQPLSGSPATAPGR